MAGTGKLKSQQRCQTSFCRSTGSPRFFQGKPVGVYCDHCAEYRYAKITDSLMKRKEKEQTIKQFADDLQDLATQYSKLVGIRHKVPDEVIETMYETAMRADAVFAEIAIKANTEGD